MANQELDNFENMLKWCLKDVIKFHKGENVEMNSFAVKELETLLDDEEKLETIRAYWNVLSFSRDDMMIGFADTDRMFHKTVERYPYICKVLKIYMYA